MKCGKCPKPVEIGSLCVRCYLTQRARIDGIVTYPWWKKNFDRFSDLMYYRLIALREGTVPDLKTVLAAFPNHAVTVDRYEFRRKKIEAIVAAFDRLARRKNAGRPDEGSSAPGPLDDHRGPEGQR